MPAGPSSQVGSQVRSCVEAVQEKQIAVARLEMDKVKISTAPAASRRLPILSFSSAKSALTISREKMQPERNLKKVGISVDGLAKRLDSRLQASAVLRKQAIMSKRRRDDDTGALTASLSR